MTGVVVFLQSGEVPMMRHPKFIEGKTVEEICAALQLPSEKTLALKTPYYIEPLALGAVPSKLCAELSKSMPTGLSNTCDYALQIIPQSEADVFRLIVNVETTNDIVIPPFPVELNNSDFHRMKGSFIVDEIVKQFALEVTDYEVRIGKRVLDKSKKAEDVILKARTEKTYMKCTLAESAQFIVRMRENTITELMATESTYIGGLNVLLNYFARELKKILPEDKMQLVFGDVEKIMKCHVEFLNDLVGAGCKYSSQLAETFLTFSIHFFVTQPYVVNYPKMVEIAAALKTDKRMEEIVAKVPESKGLDFGGYLILPIQRMPRYILLLRELIKFTPLSHPDAFSLTVAQAKLEALTHEMEDAGDIIQGRKRVKEIEGNLARPIMLVTEDRREVATYMVMIRTPERTRGSIYLFNDLLLVTSGVEGSERLEVCRPLEVVRFIPATSDRIVSFKRESGRWLHAEFQSAGLRDEWLKKFQETREPHLDKCPPTALLSLEINTGVLMPAIEEHSSITLGDQILYSGGRFHKTKAKPCPLIMVNPESLLVEIDKMCTAEHYGSKLAMGENRVFMFGGYTNKPTAKLYKLDAMKWAQIGQKKNAFARYGHTFLYYQGSLYVFGGINLNEEPVNSLLAFKIDENKWSQITVQDEPPAPRKFHTSVIYKDMMVVYGGESKTDIFSDIWVYKFKDNTWTCVDVPDLPARTCHSAVVVNKYMLVLGGKSHHGKLVVPFCIDLDTWKYKELEVFGNFCECIGKAAVSFIPSRGTVVVYGGVDLFDDTPVNTLYGIHLTEEFTDAQSKPSETTAPLPVRKPDPTSKGSPRIRTAAEDPNGARDPIRARDAVSMPVSSRDKDPSTASFKERCKVFQQVAEESHIIPNQQPIKGKQPASSQKKDASQDGRQRSPSQFELSRQQFQHDMTKNEPQKLPARQAPKPAPGPALSREEERKQLMSNFELAKRRFQEAVRQMGTETRRTDHPARKQPMSEDFRKKLDVFNNPNTKQ